MYHNLVLRVVTIPNKIFQDNYWSDTDSFYGQREDLVEWKIVSDFFRSILWKTPEGYSGNSERRKIKSIKHLFERYLVGTTNFGGALLTRVTTCRAFLVLPLVSCLVSMVLTRKVVPWSQTARNREWPSKHWRPTSENDFCVFKGGAGGIRLKLCRLLLKEVGFRFFSKSPVSLTEEEKCIFHIFPRLRFTLNRHSGHVSRSSLSASMAVCSWD